MMLIHQCESEYLPEDAERVFTHYYLQRANSSAHESRVLIEIDMCSAGRATERSKISL